MKARGLRKLGRLTEIWLDELAIYVSRNGLSERRTRILFKKLGQTLPILDTTEELSLSCLFNHQSNTLLSWNAYIHVLLSATLSYNHASGLSSSGHMQVLNY